MMLSFSFLVVSNFLKRLFSKGLLLLNLFVFTSLTVDWSVRCETPAGETLIRETY